MTVCGSPFYIAPETLRVKFGHSFEVDIWALGICMYTMLTGKPPFLSNDPKECHNKILKGNFTFPMDGSVSKEAEDLITRLLFQNP